MYRKTLKRFYALLLAIVATSLLIMLTIFVIKYVNEQQQEIFAKDFLNTVRDISVETSNTLDKLNATLGAESCTDSKIKAMRQNLFTSLHAKEIGFYEQDKQVCNTSLGILDQPVDIQATATDIKIGDELLMAKSIALFEEDYPVYVVKSKNYHVVLNPPDGLGFETPLFEWQWVYRDAQRLVEMSGVKGLFRQYYNQPYSLDTMSVIICDDETAYCVATVDKLLGQFSTPSLVMIALGIILSMAVFYFIGNVLIAHYYSVELRIKRGIKKRSFYPLFQPIVQLETGEIIGCEVLARFKDELGHLQPDEFIPIVLKSRSTLAFTQRIIRTAMSALIHQPNLPEAFKVNFNIFPNDLTEQNYDLLSKHKELFASRFQLCFEITEDEPFKSATARLAVKRIKEVNVEIAIDDFGTGYSNLSQLQSIPFDYLKIDKSFCLGLEKNAFRASLIPQIVKIAESLDVPIVAEGVETQAQRTILVREGIKLAQGFLFSRPVTALALNEQVLEQTRSS